MDAQTELARDSEMAVAVIVKGSHILLVDLNTRITVEEVRRAAQTLGYQFCGVLGVRSGVASAKCEPSLEAINVCIHAAYAFAEFVAEKTRPIGDGVNWLEQLHSLPDTRTEN
jgi:hypothetical protein